PIAERGRDELDSRIEAVLRSYAEPPALTEPRVVLASVMERARAERPARLARSVRWWMWGVAGAACLVAVVLAVWMMRGPRGPEIAKARTGAEGVHVFGAGVAVKQGRSMGAEAQESSGLRSARLKSCPDPKACAGRNLTGAERASDVRPRGAEATNSLPKLAEFPTPRPLTPQEQALLAFAKHAPPDVRRAVLEDQQHWDDPIIVADLGGRSPEPHSQQDR
ncbi:MAG: hypothetical protein WB622_11190, partial [Acidobacteriaceae bacterium]